MSSLFEVRVSLVSLEDMKLIAIDNRFFQSPWVLRSFILLLKYGLILRRYYSIDSVLPLSPILSYFIYLLLKALPIFTGS